MLKRPLAQGPRVRLPLRKQVCRHWRFLVHHELVSDYMLLSP